MDARKILLVIFDGLGDRPLTELGDIAFRGNFASVDEDLKLTDRRAGRIREGTEELAKALDGLKLGRIKANVREGTEHRVAVVLRGRGLSSKVTDTDPHEIGEMIQESKPLESAAKVTAKAVNAFTKQSYKILKSHPVNRARVAKGEP